jgi:acyl transferase domain-containing protein/acyl carrier protein
VTKQNYDSAIAIIGMSGRFPGADSVEALWTNLTEGRSGLRPVTDEDLAAAGINPALTASPAYVRVAAPVAGIDLFDAAVFGFSRREAETMDPQQRLFLECAWEALEIAGYQPNRVLARVGVFAGSGFADYLSHVVPAVAGLPGGALLLAVGNERDALSSKVSYKLDLRGPSVTVQTFCSTSLVAVHLAVQSLLSFECDMALAGGAYIALPQSAGYMYEEGGITSPDGRVCSFDAAARGTVLGNGVAAVTLKRMTEALADGDHIHAVILGSASNNDGRACAGYTAPGVNGQAEVVEMALAAADVRPESIGYVECHATGTMLGDSIELAALSRALGRTADTPCVLSSLKPSIGHLDRASGVTGLIRTAIAMREKILSATPNFETPNPALAAVPDRFKVLDRPQHWAAGEHPRRAGVSSFGFGGTNAHVIVEEAPPALAAEPRPGPHLLVLSARDLTALYASVERLRVYLNCQRQPQLADVAYTLQQSRTGFAVRWAAVCRDRDDALRALADPGRWLVAETEHADVPVEVRVPAADAAPASWWRDLHAAASSLTGSAAVLVAADVGSEAVHKRAVEAVLEALARLAVRVDAESTGPGAVFSLAPDDEQPADEVLLTGLAGLWQAGVTIDWTALHGGRPLRVPLPTYPFQRQRYWLPPQPDRAPAAVPFGKIADLARWTYLPAWRQRRVSVADLPERLRAAGPWLLFADGEYADALARPLVAAGADVTIVRSGPRFGRTDTGDFTVRPDDRGDLVVLLRMLVVQPRMVVHGFSLVTVDARDGTSDPGGNFDGQQGRGFHSVLALIGALDERGGAQSVELTLLTAGTVEVIGGDLRHPEHATLLGLAPVLAQENPGLVCRLVDVDSVPQANRLNELASRVVVEAVQPHEGPVAWRGRQRWVRSYEPQEVPAAVPGTPLRPGSTMLITGGLGKVGYALSRHAAAAYGCRLVLTVRSPLPPREEWEEFLARSRASSDKTVGYLRKVLDLERGGAEVLALAADVADAEQMARVVHAAAARFGGIDAVVHAAGVQDAAFFGLAHTLDRNTCAAHFAAKVHGFHVLQQVLPTRLQPRLTLSSLSTVLGGLTFGAYAAANAALDAYAVAARDRDTGRWLTVDWDAWRVDDAPGTAAATSVSAYEMTVPEGLAVFDRALAATGDLGHLVVSTGPLAARLDQWVIRPAAAEAAGDTAAACERDPRPELSTPYLQPESGVEATLAEIWGAVLGVDRVGVDDNFYQLGGDSILAIELIARIRKELRLAVPVTVLLEQSSVRQMAVQLTAARKEVS